MSGLQGYAAEGTFVRARFEDQWGDTTPVAWDNDGFEPPDGPWVRLSVLADDAETASIGAPTSVLHRHIGTVLIEVFTPKNALTTANDALCDQAAAVFRHHRGDGIRFETPRKVRVGVVEGRYKQDVLTQFVRDTIFTS